MDSIGTVDLVVLLVAALMAWGPRNPRQGRRAAVRHERSKETRA